MTKRTSSAPVAPSVADIVAAARDMVAQGLAPDGTEIPAGHHVTIDESDGSFMVTADAAPVVVAPVEPPMPKVDAAQARAIDYVMAPAVTVLTPPEPPAWVPGIDTADTFQTKLAAYAEMMAAYADAAARLDVYRSITMAHIDDARAQAIAAAERAFVWHLTAHGVPANMVPAVTVTVVAATERRTDVVARANQDRRERGQRTRNTSKVLVGYRALPVGDVGRYNYKGHDHTLTVAANPSGGPNIYILDAGTPTEQPYASVSTAVYAAQTMHGGQGIVNGWRSWRWDSLNGRTAWAMEQDNSAAAAAAVAAAQ